MTSWTKVVEGRLEDVTSTIECAPTMFYVATQNTWARYVRFRDISHYKNGPALAYFAPVAPGN